MQFGDQLGLAGLILGLLGIGVTILWPTQRWIGWLCIFVALALASGWGWYSYHVPPLPHIATQPKIPPSQPEQLPPTTPSPPVSAVQPKPNAKPKRNTNPNPTPCMLTGATYYADTSKLPGGPQLNRPMLELEGTYGFDYHGLEIAWAGPDGEYLALINVALTNRGSDSIVKDWQLCLLVHNKATFFQVGAIPAVGVVLPTGQTINNNDTLTEKAIREQIKRGHREVGWVAFSVPSDLAKELMADQKAPSGSIWYKDVLAHTYSWDFDGKLNTEVPGRMPYVPGLN